MSPKKPTPMSRLKDVFKAFEDAAMLNIGNKVEFTRRDSRPSGYFDTGRKEIKTDFFRIYQKEDKYSNGDRNESFGFSFNYEGLDQEQIMVTFQDENKVIVSSLAMSTGEFRPIMKSATKEIKSRSVISYEVIKSILQSKFLPNTEALHVEVEDVVAKAAKERIDLAACKKKAKSAYTKAEKALIEASDSYDVAMKNIPELKKLQELERQVKELKAIISEKKDSIENKFDVMNKRSTFRSKRNELEQAEKSYDKVIFLASRQVPFVSESELEKMITQAEKKLKNESKQ